jgi:formylmethanofuran dehydrogenase subunit E
MTIQHTIEPEATCDLCGEELDDDATSDKTSLNLCRCCSGAHLETHGRDIRVLSHR